jgi:uncharacterized damage-inducible protein DinB
MEKDQICFTFHISNHLVTNNIENITHEESMQIPKPEGNSINWTAGHILSSRNAILKQLGLEPILPEEDITPYKRNSPKLGESDSCVPFEKLQAGLNETGKKISATLSNITEEKLQQPLNARMFPVPVEKPTVGALLFLLVVHESYHAGQMGLGRRLLGKEAQLN